MELAKSFLSYIIFPPRLPTFSSVRLDTPMSSSTKPREGQLHATSYTSRAVSLPDDFLVADPPDATPITYAPIEWASTALPENGGHYAAVLDGVLSRSECAQLLAFAEESVTGLAGGDASAWRPALVNAGPGLEVLMTDYRNSDRIVWDNQEVMDRLWRRMVTIPEVRDKLARATTGDTPYVFDRVNERGRYLRYGPGQFFKPHCDGPYYYEKDGKAYLTFFTIQLYLNDSVEAFASSAEARAAGATLRGGATAFLARRHRNDRGPDRRVDVHPRAGRVLLFQHEALYHSGERVTAGVKYTMRTDVLFSSEAA
ncbi:hypothetical protein Q8F55_000665 [Vanrija albida]|uniref:Prolyl 4-hydroxylase alpha subunit domain-containing protein n=1 Tax=Vanrija albida TaxID=181172 RepID=A0ABR3QDX8_9TREE